MSDAVRVLVMRAPGTNCDAETVRAFREVGARVDLVHTQVVFRGGLLEEYDVLVFPGGFSYGDYVRSGAIWAKECEARIGGELEDFVDEGKAVVGICNGFQQLVEMGFLPGWEGRSEVPQAALANNSHGYQNRWVRIRYEGRGNCGLMGGLETGYVLACPVAHGEGRFMFPRGEEERLVRRLEELDMLVWRYVKEDGSPAGGEWPANPNGALHDIAGICNSEGNVLGLMPHPERALYGYLMPEWNRGGDPEGSGDGYPFFKSIVEYAGKRR